MTANELITTLVNIKISFFDPIEQTLFSNAEVYCRMKGDINIVEEIEYDEKQNIIILY